MTTAVNALKVRERVVAGQHEDRLSGGALLEGYERFRAGQKLPLAGVRRSVACDEDERDGRDRHTSTL